MESRTEIEKWFKTFDVDGNGKIDSTELKAAIKSYYAYLKLEVDDVQAEKDTEDMLKKIDTSGDRKIDKEEFLHFFSTRRFSL